MNHDIILNKDNLNNYNNLVNLPILTLNEAKQILNSNQEYLIISLDLGISEIRIKKTDSLVIINDVKIPLSEFNKIKGDSCYTIIGNSIKKIAFFSKQTNLYYSLIATRDWPTIKLSSTPMHRHISVSPKEDSYLKIKEISPVKGIVLDSCCGLGYTAILSAKHANKVYSLERDINVIEIARYNPYSRELFNNPRIILKQGDINKEIKKFNKNYFDRVIHDPPTFCYAPELYHISFYKEIYRVMKRNGIIYHYVPSPHKTKGALFYPKIVRMLKEVGFIYVQYHKESSGVRAVK